MWLYLYVVSQYTANTTVRINDALFFQGDAYNTGTEEVKSTNGFTIVSANRTIKLEISNNKAKDLNLSTIYYRRIGTNA